MFNKPKQSGFTLVELLVVIAIIGILSSVVLAGLQDARMGAKNANIKQQMKQIQIAAQMHWDKNNNYWFMSNGYIGSPDWTILGIISQVNECSQKFNLSSKPDLIKICEGIQNNFSGPFYTFSGGIFGGTYSTSMYWAANFTQYAVWAKLNSNDQDFTKNWFCVDSNGKTFEGSLNNTTQCP